MVEIAHALKFSVADLIGKLEKTKATASFSRQMAQLAEPGASELLTAYSSIESPKGRRALLSIARQLVRDTADMELVRPERKAARR